MSSVYSHTCAVILCAVFLGCHSQPTTKYQDPSLNCPLELSLLVHNMLDRLNKEESQMMELMKSNAEKETKAKAVFMARGLADSDPDIKVYSHGERLIYRNPLINPGGYYNSTTGEYTCPVTGIYVFTYSMWGDNIEDGPTHANTNGALYQNGSQISTLYFHNYNSQEIDIPLSRSDIVRCNAGDKMWVQSIRSQNRIEGSSHLNSFSGELLYVSK